METDIGAPTMTDDSKTNDSPESIPEPVEANQKAAEAPAAPMRDTHFDFQHKVFSIEGAFFCMDPSSRQPVLHILLGDLKAALSFLTLRESFEIPADGQDSKLLKVIEQGLRFVKEIRPGEEIPGELLDGSASWAVEDRHRQAARGRLTVQLVSWITGSELVVVNNDELEQIVEDPQTKQRVKSAMLELAQRLGITENPEQAITNRIEALAHELSYIEALRERFLVVQSVDKGLTKAAHIYRTDRALAQEISRMLGLVRRPLRRYDGIFSQADAQTGEILGVLKSYDSTVTFIRKTRDDLRGHLLDWEEILKEWEAVPVERSPKFEQLMKQTYRFLAGKFLETKVWERK
jgi:hypothetical protein